MRKRRRDPVASAVCFLLADQDSCGCGSLQREVPERKSIMKYHRIITLKNGQVAGTAGIESIGNKYKVRHRAEFGN